MTEEDYMTLPDPKTEPTVTVDRAAGIVGVSRASAYEAVRYGQIPSIRIGRRILVPTAALLRLLAAEAGGRQPAA
jgi:excisionase family DNA binding protein